MYNIKYLSGRDRLMWSLSDYVCILIYPSNMIIISSWFDHIKQLSRWAKKAGSTCTLRTIKSYIFIAAPLLRWYVAQSRERDEKNGVKLAPGSLKLNHFQISDVILKEEKTIDQRFSTGVAWHTRVAQVSARSAASLHISIDFKAILTPKRAAKCLNNLVRVPWEI